MHAERAFAMLAYAIKESSQVQLLCLWLLFEKNIEEEKPKEQRGSVTPSFPHSEALR